MSLKNNQNGEEIPFPVPGIDEEEKNEIKFDDIEFEAESLSEEELEEESKTQVYYTISGKEQQYEPEWDKYGIQDLDVGAVMEGKPEITIFENEDKSYNALRLRILDDGEILDLYINYPKKHFPYVRNINPKFDFYRKCFDFIFSVLNCQNPKHVQDNKGNVVNKFGKINLEMLAKYVDQHNHIGVKITEGNSDSKYDSFMIFTLE